MGSSSESTRLGPMGDVSADTGTRPGTAPSGAGSADRGSPTGTFSTASSRVSVLSVDGTSDRSTSASKVPETLTAGEEGAAGRVSTGGSYSVDITIHMPVRTSRILLVRFLSNQSANIFFGSFTLFSHYAH